MQKKQRNSINGWLNINKPAGVTSTKVVAILKRYYNAKKVGHAGTLDPLAEGVLPIAFGEATKTINYMMDAKKEYEFTIKWGEATSTGDAEGEIIQTSKIIPAEQEIQTALPFFIGEIEQTPPAFSAIKIDGKRAYDLARQGKEVTIKSRKVSIYTLEYLGANTFRTQCSKGTYIRSLAIDLAAKLGTQGHVTMLKRTKVGNFCIKSAILLDMFDNKVYKDGSEELLLPVEQVLDDIPVLDITNEEATSLRQGKTISFKSDGLTQGDITAVKSNGKLIALCEVGNAIIKPSRVFNL
ncbi:MAG: tRNA pseudouridine(55) synthase TruB [Rickettsiales bacterium]|nr:tRNA pseudouridine(55) synthase TruB [Pseudomonadota bacterium]MDA0966360.1 tRNA pseudouridine(55) synthase TruB [Pseudomonadota bacterium]MDG4543992.1 tRNA pseudouridine(55) synthase TruB [Rickettsiales bacterium]MDG4545486.1 tRNA pseudouridine(55) synthase TruB [Rickettsiales bacterium]MDG4547935.1 tRNA pseudouridine(55) synthase TruB [Rickettsiales bacterium]